MTPLKDMILAYKPATSPLSFGGNQMLIMGERRQATNPKPIPCIILKTSIVTKLLPAHSIINAPPAERTVDDIRTGNTPNRSQRKPPIMIETETASINAHIKVLATAISMFRPWEISGKIVEKERLNMVPAMAAMPLARNTSHLIFGYSSVAVSIRFTFLSEINRLAICN
jgi:hypothetical protein